MTDLLELQSRFQDAVLSQDVTPGLFVEEGHQVAGGVRLYLMAYRARLLSALRDNYPVLHRALGDEAFADMAYDFIEAHPSSYRSIRWYGDELVDFLDADHQRLPHPALADVARMDWAIRGAFDAPDSVPLSLSYLRELPAHEWPRQHFRPIASLRLLELNWSVEPIWRALNESAEAQTEAPEVSPHTLLVWRPKLECLWRSAAPVEVAALSALMRGANFAECCAAIAEAGDVDPAMTAAGLLQRWVADGLLDKQTDAQATGANLKADDGC